MSDNSDLLDKLRKGKLAPCKSMEKNSPPVPVIEPCVYTDTNSKYGPKPKDKEQ